MCVEERICDNKNIFFSLAAIILKPLATFKSETFSKYVSHKKEGYDTEVSITIIKGAV